MHQPSEGETKSNAGGWQSPPLPLHDGSPQFAPLRELAEHVREAGLWFISDGLGDDLRRQSALATGEYKLELAAMWMNINRGGDYNHAHTHPDSFLSGVYYAQAGGSDSGSAHSDGGGELVLHDPRLPQLQQFEYMGWYGLGAHRRIAPAAGKLVLFPSWLLHRVDAMATTASGEAQLESERVSISFNLQFFPSTTATADQASCKPGSD